MPYKIFMLLAGCFFLVTAVKAQQTACANIPADIKEPNTGVIEWLGGGYDTNRERIKVMSCLNGNKVRDPASSIAALNLGLLTDYEEINREVNRSSGGKIKIGWFSFGKNRSFVQRITDKAYSQTFVLKFDVQTGNGRFDIDSNDPLNDLADRVKHNACEFKKFCGDEFVFQTEEGVKLLLALQISFSSHSHFQQYQSGYSAGIEGSINKTFNIPGPCCSPIPIPISIPINFSFKGEFSKSIGNITSSLRKQGQIDVFALQIGGDVAQLGGALGANGALGSCSLDNHAACLQMADNALAYLASSAFIEGVKNDPAVLSYKRRPYWEVDPAVPNMPSEISSEIDNARLQLATEFDNRLVDTDQINTTLALSLSDARRQQLTELKQTLAAETQKLHETGLICFSDLANCPQEAEKVLSGLLAYDQMVMLPNPTEGLVAYYPFNGNALDETKNGNDGVVYSAVLTSDRTGKMNSSYLFNGKNSFIEVPHNSQLNVGESGFSVAFWFNPVGYSQWPIHVIIGKSHLGGPNSNGWVIECVNDGVNATNEFGFGFGNGVNWTNSAGSTCIYDDQWHFVVGSFDGSMTKFYVDGELASSAGLSGKPRPNQGSLYIGKWFYTQDRFFNGSIDDIRIYNRGLTDTEIQQLYATTSTEINQSPLAAFTTTPTSGNASLHVTMDATASGDTDGNIVSYDWNAGSGLTASGQLSSLTFNAPGTYSLTLTVTDDKGAVSQAVKNITIGNITPPSGCTNSDITKCDAVYSTDGKLCAPCVVVPGVFGSSQIFAIDFIQESLSLTFKINPPLKQHNFRDQCAANYQPTEGLLNLPCVLVGTSNYNVDMQQRPGLTFEVIDVR